MYKSLMLFSLVAGLTLYGANKNWFTANAVTPAKSLAEGGIEKAPAPSLQSMDESKKTPYRWFDFYGTQMDQYDPTAYTLDPNNFPDCQMALGLIYCEIYAIPSGFDPYHPDLSTITQYRMRPMH